MNATGLDLLFLEVNSLEESLAFYDGVLGLDLDTINVDAEPPMATLKAGASEDHLGSAVGNDVPQGAWSSLFYWGRGCGFVL